MIHGITGDGKPIEVDAALPSDWRKFHADNVAKLDRRKALAAAEFLREWTRPVAAKLKAEMEADPEWWVGHHHGAMMSCRNELRANGFGERELGIDNLDDYAVGLLELALGVTTLP